MSFKNFLLESAENLYVHVTYIKGNDTYSIKKIEEKITNAFYKLKYEEAPDKVDIIKNYTKQISPNKFYYTLVFKLNGNSNIIKTPRYNDIIIQTSNNDKELK